MERMMASFKYDLRDDPPMEDVGGVAPGGSPLGAGFRAFAQRAAGAAALNAASEGVRPATAVTLALPTAPPVSAAAPSPAVTQNAVNTARDMSGAQEPRVASVTPPGKVSARAPDAGQPYPGKPQVENVTSRLAARDSAGVDFGMPRMSPSYQQVAMGGDGGMFPPSLMSAIQGYHDMSMKANDGSIAGAWRSRGLAKKRDNLLERAIAAQNAGSGAISAGAQALGANASMMRAQNEPALEGMKNFIAMRGQNLNFDLGREQTATQRYGYDLASDTALQRTNIEADVARRGQEFQIAPYLGQIKLDQMGVAAYEAGDPASGKEYLTAGRTAPLPRAPTMREDVSGNTVILNPDGSTRVLSRAMKDALAAQEGNAPYMRRAAEQTKAERER